MPSPYVSFMSPNSLMANLHFSTAHLHFAQLKARKVHVVAYADLHMLLVPANCNVDALLPSGNQTRIFLL